MTEVVPSGSSHFPCSAVPSSAFPPALPLPRASATARQRHRVSVSSRPALPVQCHRESVASRSGGNRNQKYCAALRGLAGNFVGSTTFTGETGRGETGGMVTGAAKEEEM